MTASGGALCETDAKSIARHELNGTIADFSACAAKMLEQCARRGIAVHWDAQNRASLMLAQKLGFELDGEYTAYCFISPKEPE
jgi:tRNA1(Val) A37 N6-methylase TrmN6